MLTIKIIYASGNEFITTSEQVQYCSVERKLILDDETITLLDGDICHVMNGNDVVEKY